MALFWIALVVGVVVAVLYLLLAATEFGRVRTSILRGDVAPETTDDDFAAQRGFSWVAGIGVLASFLLLVAASHWPLAWYLLPLLCIGSSIAVIAAFLLDRAPNPTTAKDA